MEKVLTVTLNPCIDKTVITDAFKIGSTNTVFNTKTDIGGKGINVSKVLNNFKVGNVATGILMTNGCMYIKEELDKLNIKNNFLLIEGTTRVNIKITDRKSQVTTELNECSYLNDNKALEGFIELYKELCPKDGIVVLSGSVPKGVNDDIYAKLINIATERGSKAILDCCNSLLEKGIKEKPVLVKPNISEFETLTKTNISSYLDVAKELNNFKEYGISLFVVSMGKDGAVFTDGENTVLAVPFLIDCKCTVGAGDSMIAALVYSVLHSFDLHKTAQFATAAGTLTCCYDGSSVCTLDEVNERYSDVIIKEIG